MLIKFRKTFFYKVWTFFVLFAIQKPFFHFIINIYIPHPLRSTMNYFPFMVCLLCLFLHFCLFKEKINYCIVFIGILLLLFSLYIFYDCGTYGELWVYSFFSIIIFLSLSCIDFTNSFFSMAKPFFVFNTILIPILLYIYFKQIVFEIQFDYMLLGQALTPISVFFIFYWLHNPGKVLSIIISLIILGLITLFANRGAFLWTICSYGVVFIRLSKKRKQYFLIFLILVFLSILFFLNSNIVDMSFSRTITKLLDHSATTDSGRSFYHFYAKEQLNQNPFLGIGINNSRNYLFQQLALKTWNAAYPHNFFLEIFMQFGLILPLVFIFLFFVKCCLKIHNTGSNNKDVLLYVILAFFLRLMLSGSYLIDFSIPMLLAFICNNSLSKGRSYD